MEEWKWEVWEAEYRAKHSAVEEAAASIASAAINSTAQHEEEHSAEKMSIDDTESRSSPQSVSSEEVVEQVMPVSAEETAVQQTSTPPPSAGSPIPIGDVLRATVSLPPVLPDVAEKMDSVKPPPTDPSSTLQRPVAPIGSPSLPPEHNTVASSPRITSVTFSTKGFTSAVISTTPPNAASSIARNSSQPASHAISTGTESATHGHGTGSTVISPLSTVVPHHTVPIINPGESIFRTIMTRLSLLEANSTLYARYVEEQTRSVREALRRLEEDVGRIEGIVSVLC